MSRLKNEILNKLKEYAGKMGTDHLGGDDYTSKKRGGLRDFDGYDNVDYNQDMPMDEMQVVNKKTGKDITKHVLALLSGKIDKKKFEKLTGLKKESVNEAKDMTLSDYIKILDKKIEDAQKAVSGKNGSKEEYDNRGDILQNFRLFRNYLSAMDKRHKGNKKKLRFVTENFDNLVEACWKGYKAVGGKIKNGKQVPNCVPESVVQEAMRPSQIRSAISKVKKQLMRKWKQKGGYENFGQKELSQMKDKFDYNPYGSPDERTISKMLDGFDNWAMNYDGNMRESVNESMFSAIDQIRQDSKNVRDFVKNVFKDREFKKMSNDKDFIKYLKSIYEGINEAIPQNFHQGRTSDYHTALRGKNKDYSGGTNFKKNNHGQPDIEEEDEDQETNHLSNKQTHIKSPLKMAESGKKKSDKNYKDWKSTNEGFDKIEHLSLLNKALRAIPGSQKQKDIIRKLNVVRKSGGMRPLKELSIVEYGQRLDLSFIEDEEAKLDGTYPSTDAIDRDIDETAKRDYKDEYKKFQSSKKSKKYRAELNKYNRQKGTYGNGDGKDASHKGGKIVGFESASKNRGRKEKSRLKKENVAPNHNDKSAPYGSGYKKVNEVGQFPVTNYIKGIIPQGRLNTNTPEAKKQSVKMIGDLKKTLNKFWKSHDIPYRIR